MKDITLTANGTFMTVKVGADGIVRLSGRGAFAGDTITYQEKIGGIWEPVTDPDNGDADFAWTAKFNEAVHVSEGDILGLILTNSSGAGITARMSGADIVMVTE